MQRDVIAGANFSGRSKLLHARLKHTGPAFFLGPYAEAALSGLSSTVADEIAVYAEDDRRTVFAAEAVTAFGARKPATLSGGEQVMLALHCFSRSVYRTIGIDAALEQLDAANRAAALAYLSASHDPFAVMLIDNRLDQPPAGWALHAATDAETTFACRLADVMPQLQLCTAPAITLAGIDFGYPSGRTIFRNLDLTLAPGRAYWLTGPNGAGKSTLFKLLVGVLKPVRGAILLDGMSYQPQRGGNRAFALATQNPDHQWCGATLAEDHARRRRALKRNGLASPSDERLAALARCLGIADADQHLYELPLAARKRLSWLWPLSGAMPWIMLDEPTIGQDGTTRAGLAAIVARLCELGYGVLVVTHDDEFARGIPHQPLHIEGLAIRVG
jgi:energy-coupling factor transporter ATP-binding protein EcfA2